MAILPFFLTKEKIPQPSLEQDTEYCNSRYFFCASFPDTLLPIQLVSDNDDGIILRSEDEKIVVTIAGSRGVLNRDTWDLYDDFVSEWMVNNKDGKIITEKINKSYYQVSFVDGDHQYFQQLFNRGNRYIIYQIAAPKNMSERIDQIRKNLDISFNI